MEHGGNVEQGDEELRSMERRLFAERSGFIPLNEVLAYGVDQHKHEAHIHVAPSKGERGLRGKILEGLRKLAHILETELKDVEVISGTSWIVAQNPGILERLGFTVEEGDISPEFRAQHFAGETRLIRRATINRANFLQRYL